MLIEYCTLFCEQSKGPYTCMGRLWPPRIAWGGPHVGAWGGCRSMGWVHVGAWGGCRSMGWV